MRENDRFVRAFALAYELHQTQRRKGSGVPYIAHLMSVSAIVIEHGGDEDQAIAALLHDAVEDQGGQPTLDRIRHEFGDNVAEIVAGCSDSNSLPKPPWRQRKEQYIDHLLHASAQTRLVSAADKLHNARAILADYRQYGEAVWQRFKGGREGTLWYYHTLVNTFHQLDDSPLIDELARVVSELERLADISE